MLGKTFGVPASILAALSLAALPLAACSPDSGTANAKPAPASPNAEQPKQDVQPAQPASTAPAPAAAAAPTTPPAAAAPAAPKEPPLDWRSAEAPLLTNHLQLTGRHEYVRAGEAYFSPDSRWIIFQAVPVPAAGQEPDPFYAMFAAELIRDPHGRITGMQKAIRLSEPGTANTCGFFHPQTWATDLRYDFIFGSTIVPPKQDQKAGFQVGTRKYQWMFPEEMEIMTGTLASVAVRTINAQTREATTVRTWEPYRVQPLFNNPRYDAECGYSPNGRFVVYSRVREEQEPQERPDADIWIYDTAHQKHYPIVTTDGYDGGPFFSPDGKHLCYRSDRRGDDRLQLFVAELDYNDDDIPVGVKREHQITDDSSVNWAPFWHPSGEYLVYGTSSVGHHNYEIFAVEVDFEKPPAELRQRRISFADGADVLPVFNREGNLMMWTAQRGSVVGGEDRPSSQIWIAEVVPGGLDDPEKLFAEPTPAAAAPEAP